MSEGNKRGHEGKNSFKRPRYFDGQVLGAHDFQAEQDYHRGKRRLLNRALYGSGIVCGLEVDGDERATQVRVDPGVALDPHGNEICVEERVTVDLCALLPEGQSTSSADDSATESRRTRKLFLCIQYTEAPEDPVPIAGAGEYGDEQKLEFSRYREGFRIVLRDAKPGDLKPRDCSRVGLASARSDEPNDGVALGIVVVDEDARLVDARDGGSRTYVLT